MKLSIITVCKNAELSIEKTIESVINQSFTDYEYIIVDGASEDRTMNVIGKYSQKINKLISGPDKGIYDAMNKGIEISEGEYLIFLNAGDYFVNTDVLKKVFDLYLTEDIIYGDTLILHRNKLIRKPASSKVTRYFMFYDTIPHQNVFVRKIIFETVGLFDINYKIAGDYDFFLRVFFQFQIKSKYYGFPITVNILDGISADRKNKKITYGERKIAQDLWFNKNYIIMLRNFKPIFYIFQKYPKSLINIILSLISKKYLRIENK